MLAGLIACALSIQNGVSPRDEKNFIAHLREYGLSFTGEEYQLRLGLFLANSRFVEEQNSADRGFLLGLNNLATWTNSEYQALLGRIDTDLEVPELPATRAVQALPVTYSWKDQGKVQDVKDQGRCGGCWAFGSIGAQESMWAINKNTLYSLSEQNLLDCVTTCYACNGGNAIYAYSYVISRQAGGFNLETSYPYEGKRGTCRYSSAGATTKIVAQGQARQDETALQNVVYQYGPVTVAIDASHNSFQLYRTGVYSESLCSSRQLDHEVLLVGWGTDPSSYWLVKNSWGTRWGELGYIKMTRGKNNQCGIATEGIVPLLTPLS
jgi:cathepsin L